LYDGHLKEIYFSNEKEPDVESVPKPHPVTNQKVIAQSRIAR